MASTLIAGPTAGLVRRQTHDLLRRAGIGPGMRVLDAGCGTGDVAFLAASLVGDAGWVTGADLDHEALALAQGRAALARLRNVRFRQHDLEHDELSGTYDAVVARGLLLHVDDGVGALARLARGVRPGGVLVVQELAPAHGWTRLSELFAAAGLPAPQLHPPAPADATGGDGHVPGLVGAWTRLPDAG